MANSPPLHQALGEHKRNQETKSRPFQQLSQTSTPAVPQGEFRKTQMRELQSCAPYLHWTFLFSKSGVGPESCSLKLWNGGEHCGLAHQATAWDFSNPNGQQLVTWFPTSDQAPCE